MTDLELKGRTSEILNRRRQSRFHQLKTFLNLENNSFRDILNAAEKCLKTVWFFTQLLISQILQECYYMEHTHKIHCITKVPIFNHLSRDDMAKVVSKARSKHYDKGEIIFLSAEDIRALYIVHKGVLKHVRVSPSGREQIVRTLETGDFIGELSVFRQSQGEGYLEALQPSEVCMLRARDLQPLLRQYPDIADKILGELSERLAEAESRIEQLGTYTVKQRLANFLLHYANKDIPENEPLRVTIPFRKGDLASLIGTSQETLSRRLGEFQDQGWITQSGQRTLIIHDKDVLQKVASGKD